MARVAARELARVAVRALELAAAQGEEQEELAAQSAQMRAQAQVLGRELFRVRALWQAALEPRAVAWLQVVQAQALALVLAVPPVSALVRGVSRARELALAWELAAREPAAARLASRRAEPRAVGPVLPQS